MTTSSLLREAKLPEFIDSTMLSCFRSCPQKYFNEFVLGLRPAEVSIDLHAGGAFAHAREVFAKKVYLDGTSVDEARKLAHQAFATYWGDVQAPERSPKTQGNVWLAFDEYLVAYPPDTDHVQPYFVEGKPTFEFSFAEPLVDAGFPKHPTTGQPFLYAGRFDQLGSYHTRPVVLDDKTTKAAGATWADQWDLRSQFMGYVWACQRQGINLDTVVIRGVVIQKTSIRILEAIKNFSPHLIEMWYTMLKRDLHRLVAMWNTYDALCDQGHPAPQTAFDYNFADACTAYGSCMFRDMCLSKPELHSTWSKSYKVRHWNPLLPDPIDSKAAYEKHQMDPTAAITMEESQ